MKRPGKVATTLEYDSQPSTSKANQSRPPKRTQDEPSQNEPTHEDLNLPRKRIKRPKQHVSQSGRNSYLYFDLWEIKTFQCIF